MVLLQVIVRPATLAIHDGKCFRPLGWKGGNIMYDLESAEWPQNFGGGSWSPVCPKCPPVIPAVMPEPPISGSPRCNNDSIDPSDCAPACTRSWVTASTSFICVCILQKYVNTETRATSRERNILCDVSSDSVNLLERYYGHIGMVFLTV